MYGGVAGEDGRPSPPMPIHVCFLFGEERLFVSSQRSLASRTDPLLFVVASLAFHAESVKPLVGNCALGVVAAPSGANAGAQQRRILWSSGSSE